MRRQVGQALEDPEGWHGWNVGGVTYHVGNYPGRRRLALYRVEGSVARPVGYFRTEQDARKFLEWLDEAIK